jgi:hypothetical protein
MIGRTKHHNKQNKTKNQQTMSKLIQFTIGLGAGGLLSGFVASRILDTSASM